MKQCPNSYAHLQKYSFFVIIEIAVGAWRSLGAHLNGVQVVAGSNPAAPTFVYLNTLSACSSGQFGRLCQVAGRFAFKSAHLNGRALMELQKAMYVGLRRSSSSRLALQPAPP